MLLFLTIVVLLDWGLMFGRGGSVGLKGVLRFSAKDLSVSGARTVRLTWR